MKTFYEMLPILAEARAPKGTPTSLNIWVMFKSLEKGGGVISDRVESVDLIHLRRCLEAGFLERGTSGFVPTPKGIEAMEKELALKMSRDPSYKRPVWMGPGSDSSRVVEWMEEESQTQFGSFVKDGQRYNCVYDPKDFKKGKGYLVSYFRKEPMRMSFYQAPDQARAKTILPFQMPKKD